MTRAPLRATCRIFSHHADSVFMTQLPSLAAPAPSSLKPHHSVVFPPLHLCSTHSLRLSASSYSLLWSRRLQPPSGSITTRRESQMCSRSCSFFFPPCIRVFFFFSRPNSILDGSSDYMSSEWLPLLFSDSCLQKEKLCNILERRGEYKNNILKVRDNFSIAVM